MQVMPDDVSGGDLIQWLSGCWVLLGPPLFDTPELAFVSENAGGSGGVVRFATRERQVTNVPNRAILTHWPLGGYVNVPALKLVMDVERVAKKQWTRTYNPRYVTTRIPRQEFITASDDISRHAGPNQYYVVAATFFPTYFGVRQALHMIEHGGWRSVALTRRTLLTCEDEIKIVQHNTVIGTLTPNAVSLNDGIKPKSRFLKLFDGFPVYIGGTPLCQ